MFLSNNLSSLSELRRDFCNSIAASHKLQLLSTFFQNMIAIGAALAVRERFLLCLGDSSGLWVPTTYSSVEALVGSIDIWSHPCPNSGEIAFQMAADIGLVHSLTEKDITLQRILKEVLFDSATEAEQIQSMRLYELLPVAFAAIFISARWDSVRFDPDKGAFDANEHLISFTISKLLIAISGNDVGLSQDQTPIQRLKESAELFLEVSSHIFAVMRAQENEPAYKNKPLRPMVSVLESVVTSFPEKIINRSTFEKHFPYALIHSDNMDIALGKIKYSDNFEVTAFDDE